MAVYNGSQLQLYVNGASAVTPKQYSGGIGKSSAPFMVGSSSVGKGFNGAIDELVVYRSLTTNQ